jgi:hypothetical protein
MFYFVDIGVFSWGCVPWSTLVMYGNFEGEDNDIGWLLVNSKLSLVRLSQVDIRHYGGKV